MTLENQQWNDWYEIVENERKYQNPLGFTREFQYLVYLKIQKDLNKEVYNEDLVEALKISEKQAYLYAKDLEVKKYITRKRRENRKKKIEITKKGEDLLYQRILVVFSETEQNLVLQIIQNKNLQIKEIAAQNLLNNYISYVIPELKEIIECFFHRNPTIREHSTISCTEVHKSIYKLLCKKAQNFCT